MPSNALECFLECYHECLSFLNATENSEAHLCLQVVVHVSFIKLSNLMSKRLRVGDSGQELHRCSRGVDMGRVMRVGGGANRERTWPH